MHTLTCEYCGTEFRSKRKVARFCSLAHANAAQVIPPEKRFWKYIDQTGECWLWTGACDSSGYGVITIRNGTVAAVHRFAYELQVGPIPAGLLVMHSCDTPLCVRPEHLVLGTQAENYADMLTKQRHPRGERHGRSKLTEADVREIRRRYAVGGINQTQLGAEFGVGQDTISDVIRHVHWIHTEDPFMA